MYVLHTPLSAAGLQGVVLPSGWFDDAAIRA
jgi:hypothetical protein